MVLRLAFSVAVHTEPRILIVDEALAVGDAAFRQRCMRRIHDLRAAGVTILFVSHDTGDVKALCERCLWLDRGLVRGLGEADEVVARYLATTVASHQKPGPATAPAPPLVSEAIPGAIPEAIPTPLAGTHRYGNRAAEVIACSRPAPDAASDVFLRLRVRALDHVAAPILGFLVRNAKGETIFGTNSARENHPLPALRPGEEHSVDFLLDMPRLAPGPYTISAAVSNGAIDKFEVCDYIEDALAFTVEPHARPVEGYLELPCRAVVIHRHAPDS